MKYKNIKSAIHNFGHSFVSLMNYVDDDYIIDEMNKLVTNNKLNELSINFLTGQVEPKSIETKRIKKSISYYQEWLPKHLKSHEIEPSTINQLIFKHIQRTIGFESYITAIDNQGHKHEVLINGNS